MSVGAGDRAGAAPGTIGEWITSASVEADATAVIEFDRSQMRTHTRAALFERAGRLAAGLFDAGLERGDRVVVMAPNSADWLVAMLGIVQCGGVVVPVDTQMPAEDLAHTLADARPRWIFTTAALYARLPDTGGAEVRLFHDGDGEAAAWTDLFAERSTASGAGADDIAAIFYTSGTTGPPKGVPLTHANLVSNVQALASLDLADANDRILVPVPFHHVYPFSIGLLTPLALGAPIVIPFSLVGPQIVRALHAGEATILLGVPRLYEAIWQALQERVRQRGVVARAVFSGLLKLSMVLRSRFDWRLGRRLFRGLHRRMAPGLRFVVSGGAALDPVLARRLQALGWEVGTGYGLSETSPIVTFNPPDRIRLASAGMPLPGVEVAIDSDEGPGEVLVRGPNVFSGYRNLPEKTAEVLSADGWFRTGDLGEMDGDGYLYLHGRVSAVIVTPAGENVDPERVEAALEGAAEIHEAGVIEHDGRLAAAVVPSAQCLREVREAELETRVRQAVDGAAAGLPSHHRPEVVRVALDPLPRTRLGKLRRHKLVERLRELASDHGAAQARAQPLAPEEMAPEDQQLLSDPVVERTWEYLAERFHDHRLTPDSHLALDLEVDSLAWVDLTLALRDRAGIEFDEAVLARVETVRDLLREAAGASEAQAGTGDATAAFAEPEKMLRPEQLAWLQPQRPWERAAGYCLLGLLRFLTRLLVRVEVQGRIPADRPCLIAPRHLSLIDPFVLLRALKTSDLPGVYWAGATVWLFRWAPARWFSRATQILPVDNRSGPRSSIALGVACLRRGFALVWFPEGQRSPDASLLPVRRGVGRLLRAEPVPVVPVWIEGTYEVLPMGKWLPRPGRVRIIIGESLPAERLADDPDAIAEQVQEALAALESSARRG